MLAAALGLGGARQAPRAGQEVAELRLDGAVHDGPHPGLPDAVSEVLEDGVLEVVLVEDLVEEACIHRLHHAVGIWPEPRALPASVHHRPWNMAISAPPIARKGSRHPTERMSKPMQSKVRDCPGIISKSCRLKFFISITEDTAGAWTSSKGAVGQIALSSSSTPVMT